MSKAILVMDMPEYCSECPLLDGNDECIMQDEDRNAFADTFDQLREGCPLRELPERKETKCYDNDDWRTVITKTRNEGWNARLKAIEGKTHEENT